MEKKSRGARLHRLPLEPMMLAADRPGHRCERPEQGGGRRRPTSLNSKAQESLPWQGAPGRPQPARQGHLLPPAPAIPRGPEEVRGGGCFPGPRLGAAGSWQSWPASTSLFSILYQVSGSQALPGSLCLLLKDGEAPSSPQECAVLPNGCGVTHTQGAVCMLRTGREANTDTGTNIHNLRNAHALGRRSLHRRAHT